MKRFQPLVFSAALLLLAACSQDPQPAEATPSFNFSVDPSAGSVSFQSAGAEALAALQIGACGSDDPRVLFAEEELALETFEFVFLPGNILEITASFTNVTDFTFEQPFTFTQADSTSNIVSSDEPEVTDADLGGDGELSPGETTTVLTFTVEHMGQPFTYEVLAEAVVRCDDGNGGPGDDDETELEVIKTIDGEVTFDFEDNSSATANFTVIVRNNSAVDAEGVVLTDTLTIDLAGLVGLEATITAGTPLPAGCVVDATVAGGNVLICTIGTVAGNTEQEFEFSFDITFFGALPNTLELEGITITNTAEVETDTPDSNPDNNIDVVVTVPGDGNGTPPGEVDLEVIKTIDGEVTTDEEGNATLDFTLVVTNNGTVAATGVTLTDTLTIDLADLLGVSATIAASLPLPEGCIVDVTVADGNVIICTIGTIEADASATIELSFDLGLTGDLTTITGPITVTNEATVVSDVDDADDTDNTVELEVEVTVPVIDPLLPDLTVTKTGDATVETNEDGSGTLNFSVTVTNNGDAIAEDVVLTDTFAIDLSVLDELITLGATILPDDSNCVVTAVAEAPGTSVVVCPLGALAAGESSTVGFSLDIDILGDLALILDPINVTNTAVVSTSSEESDDTNNTAVVAATITVPDILNGAL